MTNPMGLGTSGLTGGWSKAASIRLVHAAYEAGVRHFDVAPPYGMGTAEDVLGEALSDRRAQVTVATKVGISRPRRSDAIVLARALAAPLRKLAPALTRRVGARAYSAETQTGRFDLPFVASSLEDSLQRLRMGRIDIFLLHEVRRQDLSDELVAYLQSRKRDGTIGAIGTATSYLHTLDIQQHFRSVFDIWQYSWCVLDIAQPSPAEPTITHRAILNAARPLAERWIAYPEEQRQLSAITQLDLGDPAILARVLLGAAHAHNPHGIILSSSRNIARIRDNAASAIDPMIVSAGARLADALREGSQS
ncbi:aldo/keto reductase [uncultured Devosia sp.]|uniref:aldo/keto reductase n=1 Tax=uncultured Devosia sp. TaxID=211434 RepID=UPI0035CAB9A4